MHYIPKGRYFCLGNVIILCYQQGSANQDTFTTHNEGIYVVSARLDALHTALNRGISVRFEV